MKKVAFALVAGLMLVSVAPRFAAAQGMRMEAADHPRIAAAIRQMEDAVAYMRAAPHDFGGHKEAAIRATEAAIAELRQALAFRARMDRR